jgi:uncharacterized YigZ family protein
MIESFRTLRARLRFEPEKTKGSRHIATLVPIQSEDEARAVLDRVAAELPRASHHAYAWRLGLDRETFRYSDDGEPSGSAGIPILRQIDGRGVTNLIVVVTRYFGGTKLGVGGLVRAYGGACQEALKVAEIIEVRLTRRVSIEFDYALSSAVQAVVAAVGFEPVKSNYGERVTICFDVPEGQVESFVSELRERCANQIVIEVADSEFR